MQTPVLEYIFNLLTIWEPIQQEKWTLSTFLVANGLAESLREKYMKDIPIGFTGEEIKRMSDDDILDVFSNLLSFSILYLPNHLVLIIKLPLNFFSLSTLTAKSEKIAKVYGL